MLPLFRLSPHLYAAAGTLLIWYSTFLLGECIVWICAAVSLSVSLLPYLSACSFILLQEVWSVRAIGERLEPTLTLKKRSMVLRSTIPVDIALSLELFTVSILLFMFATTQLDISPFVAVMACFVMAGYSYLTNYSVAKKLREALNNLLGNSASEMRPSFLEEQKSVGDFNARDLVSKFLNERAQPLIARARTRFLADEEIDDELVPLEAPQNEA
jgi:hypothetical protein